MADIDRPFDFSGTLMERLGMSLEEATPELVRMTMPVPGNTQVAGILHGGATAALAETAGSLGAILHAGPERHAVGLELNITHHRGVADGEISATARAVHLGRTTAVYEIAVTDQAERRVASARLTCFLTS